MTSVSPQEFVIVGSGFGGLSVASLLAKAGHRVRVLEAHEHPGGCAHSFSMGPFTFCAAVHYIFWCGEGEPVYNFLRKLGLENEVAFARLDPEAFDHFSCPTEQLRFSIPNGLNNWEGRLTNRFPDHRRAINRFFNRINALARQLAQMPYRLTASNFLRTAWNCPSLFFYEECTLQQLFDQLGLPLELQAILSTQVGDLGLPPNQVSLLSYVALIANYGRGAYYPRRHFKHFIDSIVGVIKEAPGCQIELDSEVVGVELQGNRVTRVATADGREFAANQFIFNIDPRQFVRLVGERKFPRSFLQRVDYEYSVGSLTVFLAVKDIELRDYGFGNWNVWHYPHLDINRAYHDQLCRNMFESPWMFMSTPTLHDDDNASICPPDHQLLELVTAANYQHFRTLRRTDARCYQRTKQEIASKLLETLEQHYIPNLSRHLALKVVGTPTTNERFLWAPEGNAYGANLSPRNVNFGRLKFDTPFANVYLTGASAEFPSVGATISGGSRLYTYLTGDSVNPVRDRDGLW